MTPSLSRDPLNWFNACSPGIRRGLDTETGFRGHAVGGAHLLKAASEKRVGDFSASDKQKMDQANASKNGGQNKCTDCGQDVQKVQNKKGEKAPGNQLQRHH